MRLVWLAVLAGSLAGASVAGASLTLGQPTSVPTAGAVASFPDVGTPPPTSSFEDLPGATSRPRDRADELLAQNPYEAQLRAMPPLDVALANPYVGSENLGNPYTDEIRLMNPYSDDSRFPNPYAKQLAARPRVTPPELAVNPYAGRAAGVDPYSNDSLFENPYSRR